MTTVISEELYSVGVEEPDPAVQLNPNSVTQIKTVVFKKNRFLCDWTKKPVGLMATVHIDWPAEHFQMISKISYKSSKLNDGTGNLLVPSRATHMKWCPGCLNDIGDIS